MTDRKFVGVRFVLNFKLCLLVAPLPTLFDSLPRDNFQQSEQVDKVTRTLHIRAFRSHIIRKLYSPAVENNRMKEHKPCRLIQVTCVTDVKEHRAK